MQTNDPRQPNYRLTVAGKVLRFIHINPKYVRLTGPVGKPLKKTVTIAPVKDRPVKITDVRTRTGKHIQIQFEELTKMQPIGYRLVVENTRQTKGRYYDQIILSTDHPKRKEVSIPVHGNITAPKAAQLNSQPLKDPQT